MPTPPPDAAEVEDRASRLARRGRPVDPDFRSEERLYRRCPLTELDPDDPERLFPDQIKFYPDWSVNREKYSRPDDLLPPDAARLGIAVFQVRDIPPGMQTEGVIAYHWDAQHQPLEDNYAHAEIWTYKNGEHVSGPKLPNTVKKHFRTVLSERARILLPPFPPEE